MATQPDPFQPDYPRTPGMPRQNNLPTPQPSFPKPPNPPGLAAGAPGRPPATPPPAGVSAPPTFPTAPPAFPPAPPQGGAAQPQQKPTAKTAPQPQQPAGQLAPAVVSSVPTPGEISQAPQGAQVQTPVGTVTSKGWGAADVSLSPEGQQKYREAVVKLRRDLGPVPKFASLPGAPEMPIELGQHNFNPWTGTFVKSLS